MLLIWGDYYLSAIPTYILIMTRQETANNILQGIKKRDPKDFLAAIGEGFREIGYDATMGIINQLFYRPRSLGVRDDDYNFFVKTLRFVAYEM